MRKTISLLFGLALSQLVAAQSPGVYGDRIVVGGVLDLEGQSRGLGLNMRDGVLAAFEGVNIKGRRLEYVTLNDSYTPDLTVEQTNRLIRDGVFAMIGNVGTPTAQVALPILADNKVPAVGFFTGAGLLRPGIGDVINFRASYVQETAKVIEQGFRAGLQASEICAYVQNDAYGMAGVEGIKLALQNNVRSRDIVEKLDTILAKSGDSPERNGIGPVGVYQRNTLTSRAGFESLKDWEKASNSRCRLVVTVGTYNAIGRFAAYSKQRGEDWLISAVSFTGAENLRDTLDRFGVTDKVILTQVVPDLESDLPIVKEARSALGERLNVVSLEGYIVGKMFVAIMQSIKGDLTRESFVRATRNAEFNIGGVALDFRGDNQGSDLVTMTYFNNKSYLPIEGSQLARLF
ncbi:MULTISPECIES: ABC transporter substrate-binding protein [unclassified Hahella]|uniref:ABC transporter substrate-binding protein n=1 Tax=unclassified Hahella TaxID=2624107 RepID=UPI001C1ECD0C|nr:MULTISPECIES: ABC transporter substrate-binding protein [unclassified Hahella]MBU6951863.1 ABC transporter substrate-binding protein [Hahella sp. HN01]MDG9670748.1 ABC transporter substrate-binding protein [Hahella sp. CR1]